MKHSLLLGGSHKLIDPSRFNLPDAVKFSMFSQNTDVEEASHSDEGFGKLLEVLRACGYGARQSTLYNSCGYVMINGSVPWHVDNRLGLVASTLVQIEDHEGEKVNYPTYESIQLLTARDKPFIKPGQVFVFNANAGHAWISPYRCVLAQVTIKRTLNTN